MRLSFFNGSALEPRPPGESKNPEVRYLDLHENVVIDEAQIMRWLKQAASLPG